MPVEEAYRTEAERLGDLLFKSTDGPDPEVSNLTEEEEIELEELWVSQGYNIILGPYDHPERWVDRISGRRVAASPTQQPVGDELPRLPAPPIMTWEEVEQGCPGQLDLKIPALIPIPTVAERAFLVLAREWQAEYEAQAAPKRLTSHMGDLALACLILSVEWGKDFTPVVWKQADLNRQTAARHTSCSWHLDIVWRLCDAARCLDPPGTEAVHELLVNLDHHNSTIRCWMMEIGWFVVPWLNPVEAARRLLKNLADTLTFKAAGLAARCFDKEDNFLAFARSFTPPASFEKQYQHILKDVEERGIQTVQAPFWETEAICRKEIEQAVLGFRMRKVDKHKT